MSKKTKLILSLVCAVLFLALILLVKTVDVQPVEVKSAEAESAVAPVQEDIGLSGINTAARDAVGVRLSFYKITKYLGYLSFLVAGCFAALGLWQWISRKSLKKVDPTLWSLAIIYAMVLILYFFFEKVVVNCRPVMLPGETVPAASYPSTHTMLACVVFGSAAIALGRYVRNGTLCKALQAALWALAGLTVALRFLSGVHWLTDILGGVLISASLLFLLASAKKDRSAPRHRRARK